MDSRFKPGEIVWFQPNVEKIDFSTMTVIDTQSAVKAKIVKVSFMPDKVLYDISILVEGSFYDIFPIKSVDSVFVCPIIEESASNMADRFLQKKGKESLSDLAELRKITKDLVKRHRELEELNPLKLPLDVPYQPFMPKWTTDTSGKPWPPGTIICSGGIQQNGNKH